MSEEVKLAVSEGAIDALHFNGERFGFTSPRPFAPGTPFTITGNVGEVSIEVGAKAVRSKKREDERFDVEARLVGLRREQRIALLGSVPRPSS